jgi:site-specific recombinase XerD
LVRVPRTLPKILAPAEAAALLAALRTRRDRAMVLAMLLGGLRRCEVLGLRLIDIRVADRSLFIVEGKGGHQRVVPISNERLTEWDWPDAPARNPILHGDIPPRPEPLPKFLTDQQAATLMAAARAHRLPRYRIVIEILARTGLRASELCDLAADAVTKIGDAHWLRVPVGKLRNDRLEVPRVDGHLS